MIKHWQNDKTLTWNLEADAFLHRLLPTENIKSTRGFIFPKLYLLLSTFHGNHTFHIKWHQRMAQLFSSSIVCQQKHAERYPFLQRMYGQQNLDCLADSKIRIDICVFLGHEHLNSQDIMTSSPVITQCTVECRINIKIPHFSLKRLTKASHDFNNN